MSWGKGTVYTLGVAQLVVVGLAVILYPPASVQVFVYVPCVTNGTLTHACGETRPVRLLLTMPVLIVSAACAAFVSNTFQLQDLGLVRDDVAFGPEALGQTGLWNALFWFIVAGAHAAVVAAACSPVDLFAWALASYLCVSFLARLCSGPDVGPEGPSAGGVTIANANALGYMLGVGVALYNVPPDYSNRFILIIFTVVLDYFMGVGHMWEREPDMQTIANCRLFWTCSAGFGLAALYGAWREDLLTAPPPLPPDP
jgi:hypothetical protein